MSLSKIFEKADKKLTGLYFSFLEWSFLLNTDVMSASFILSGKLPVDNISSKRFWRMSADMSALRFNVLDGMLLPVVAFFGSILKVLSSYHSCL